ncbi:hypothetical protein HTV80_30390 [Streptomyces sp. Vc74B-19]|uniref:hypothetical protein n=1 Tax=unclassified Streptomyces TaxID=2593676 RepID=UPI001BFC5263|nr:MULTISPECIES: hypothetical protein [unclassified Streptomyces]MBT3167372.1 hypothetical protein [Streptomyces sp. Vc74B-19]MCO4696052.1 hypothetical protein [Streptomyces sp. RO-S4]
MSKQEAAETRRGEAQERVNRSVTSLKIVLALACVRLLVGPATEDFLGHAVIGLPTWEWSLFALTPPLLLFLHRGPADWELLSYDSVYLKTAAGLYLFYAVAFVAFQGGRLLWIAIVASLATFLAIWRLNRRERSSAP